ncbi:MAG TPA: hypothetical protein VJZ76_12525 [Thermoanaerobaculia bacterium]|nr:hypothetical protein [Thermoanaerobaculia bacterium]
MPKIKDLGIKVIPETIQPPEVGFGGGCGIVACTVSPAAAARPCNPTFGCTDCTNQAFSICGTTPCGPITNIAARACLPTAGCSDCTVQQFSICGTTPGHCGFTCSDCTQQPYSICGTTPGHCGFTCSDCTVQPFSICGTTPHNCLPTFQQCLPTKCGITVGCTAPFSLCGPISPRCGISIDPTIVQQQPEVTVEQIAKMKDALKQQIAALEEAEKNLGPQTAEEIDARVKQLNDELAQLQARKKTLK